jgi:hypothetical protein
VSFNVSSIFPDGSGVCSGTKDIIKSFVGYIKNKKSAKTNPDVFKKKIKKGLSLTTLSYLVLYTVNHGKLILVDNHIFSAPACQHIKVVIRIIVNYGKLVLAYADL